MERSWNAEKQFFAQSYEDLDILDSAVLVMPLVFFINGEVLSELLVTNADSQCET
jgi:GH15 family glucan-1,4-alpha-glucosidase